VTVDKQRLQELAEQIADDWPDGSCACHVVESNISAR
jgi:hypothetical protein